ncbi:hypothetical protein H6F67_05190 [Microcoleus sp. FACHB-1515]|uniref:hypothetical protein n=1 Tax=Cyanophyceae TaxID=3028117 RepID=UPI0016858473|nr:hypothetical protein [Microcoleus sp. FACHB-1515]MBD2089244.1 hypothetical protein [Microcoleus sp. FACHB-1515]
MSDRRHLRAYLRAQDLHRQIHKLTRAFEQDASDEEIKRQLEQASALLREVQSLLS